MDLMQSKERSSAHTSGCGILANSLSALEEDILHSSCNQSEQVPTGSQGAKATHQNRPRFEGAVSLDSDSDLSSTKGIQFVESFDEGDSDAFTDGMEFNGSK